MARRRGSGTPIALFSFLNILLITVGVLVLVLISVSLVSIKSEDKEIIIAIKTKKLEEGLEKKPIYVECQPDRLVIHPQQQFIPLEDISNYDAPFMRLIRNIDRNRQYIIFAVRPQGIDCFKLARYIVEKWEIDLGCEPIDAKWKLKIK